MSISEERKAALIAEYRLHDNDVGSVHVQCGILTANINVLVEHLKIHKHDFSSRRGLIQMVNKRRKLLQYLNRESTEAYEALRVRLGIRDVTKPAPQYAVTIKKKINKRRR